jgi:hypothetical protein
VRGVLERSAGLYFWTMTDPDFPQELRTFIQESIPNIDAAELLLLLARHPGREWQVAELVQALRPTVMSEAAARKQLGLFESRGLISRAQTDTCRYSPASAELGGLVRALTKAFNERPVTLVRLIYSLKDEKIRSFADAFKLKKD